MHVTASCIRAKVVIPAQAESSLLAQWIPACTGMTARLCQKTPRLRLVVLRLSLLILRLPPDVNLQQASAGQAEGNSLANRANFNDLVLGSPTSSGAAQAVCTRRELP